MPHDLVKAFAKESGKTQAEVEKIWDETKEEATKQFHDFNPNYWAYVTAVVKKKLGLKESLKFSEMMSAIKENKEIK